MLVCRVVGIGEDSCLASFGVIFFRDGCVSQKLMHFCPPGVTGKDKGIFIPKIVQQKRPAHLEPRSYVEPPKLPCLQPQSCVELQS